MPRVTGSKISSEMRAGKRELPTMFLSPYFSARLKRSAKAPVPYCKEALRQDLAGANCV
jgi:hypothetical protein